MNKKQLIIITLSFIAVILVSGVIFTSTTRARANNKDSEQVYNESPGSNTDDNSGDDFSYTPPTPIGSENITPIVTDFPVDEEILNFVPSTLIDLDPTSITVFINKEYTLPKDYRPEQLVTPDVDFNLTYNDERTLMRPEAAEALEKLFAAAEEDGYILTGISGFRSYDRQHKIFTSNIATKGKDYTLKYSAVPGTSEHQTGLAIDVSTKTLNYKLSTKFANSPEGIWLEDNAYRFGYIVRYPLGKAEVTGYAYEPWHIRYVGKELAYYLYTNELTLDEYYNYTPSPDFDFEALYADLINYKPPTNHVIPTGGTDVVIGENGEIIEGEVGESADPTDKDDEVDKDDSGDSEETTKAPTPTVTPVPSETPEEDEINDGTDPSDESGGVTDPSDESGGVTDPNTPTPTEGVIPGEDGSGEITPTPTPSSTTDSVQ